MKGYKAFNKDLRCRDMYYEIGQTYEMSGEINPCKRGFHFCKSLADCYRFYPTTEKTRICEVTALGDVKTDDGIKYCTNKIKIGKEVKKLREKSNISLSSTGYCNSGKSNSGDWNTGDWNTGNMNSGNWNTGNSNSGAYNTGNWNTGNSNSGAYNTGDWNTGAYNTGAYNSGNWNTGAYNSGDWNSGNYNSGVFCTAKKPTIRIFDKDSDWTIDEWDNSYAKEVMDKCPCPRPEFIKEERMSDEEKENHPEHKIMGGYVKVISVTRGDKQKWWDELTDEERQSVLDLPNFNAEKFEECTDITINKAERKEEE